MHILNYDIPVNALVISKGLYWLCEVNLRSLKLSGNKKSAIWPLKVSFRLRSQAKNLNYVRLQGKQILTEFCKYLYCYERLEYLIRASGGILEGSGREKKINVSTFVCLEARCGSTLEFGHLTCLSHEWWQLQESPPDGAFALSKKHLHEIHATGQMPLVVKGASVLWGWQTPALVIHKCIVGGVKLLTRAHNFF